MKGIVLLVLVISSALGAVAQSAVDGNCPTVSVFGPNHSVPTGEEVAYRVEVKGLRDESGLEYLWSVSSGEISRGQGTKEIIIIQGPDHGIGLTATVELKGLPEGCIKSVSETSVIDEPPSILLFDQYSSLKFSDEVKHYAYLEQELRKDPAASGYVIVDVKDISEQAAAVERAEKQYGQLATKDKEIASRIKIGVGVGVAASKNTSVYMVPPGAQPPDCSADCIWVPQ